VGVTAVVAKGAHGDEGVSPKGGKKMGGASSGGHAGNGEKPVWVVWMVWPLGSYLCYQLCLTWYGSIMVMPEGHFH
jgi:hypothetical protein